MSCPACGAENPATGGFCNHCGQPLAAAAVPGQPSGTTPATPAYKGPQETSGKAIASVILGAFAIPLVLFLIPGILAVVFGNKALAQIKGSAGHLKGRGMAITGLALGSLSIILFPLLIIAAIAIPSLFRSRIAANESSAVGMIRTINTAQVTYSSSNPGVGYTCSLKDLGEFFVLLSSEASRELVGGQLSGYRFTLSNCSGNPVEAYQVTAEPITVGESGVRVFCSDQTGVIRSVRDGSGASCLSSGGPLE